MKWSRVNLSDKSRTSGGDDQNYVAGIYQLFNLLPRDICASITTRILNTVNYSVISPYILNIMISDNEREKEQKKL